jgi:YtkA-like
MSHAGMAPVFEEASETGPGQYQAHLRFPMAGDWVILLHLWLPGGQKLERQFNVSGVRPN